MRRLAEPEYRETTVRARLQPVAVDKDNLVSTVIADGYQKLEEVYRDVPPDRRPKKP